MPTRPLSRSCTALHAVLLPERFRDYAFGGIDVRCALLHALVSVTQFVGLATMRFEAVAESYFSARM
jgi:hypothetical protein